MKRPRYRTYAGEVIAAAADKCRHCHRSMLQRCYNPRHPAWSRYGGRGIAVAPQWHDLETFRREVWNGLRPAGDSGASTLVLDRVDPDGDYSPGNVRWATTHEQAANTRRVRRLTIAGVTKTIAQWSAESGTPAFRIRNRLFLGWPHQDAAFTPPVSPQRQRTSRARHDDLLSLYTADRCQEAAEQ